MKFKHVNRRKRVYQQYVAAAAEQAMAVYMRATGAGSAEYLSVNQPSEPERVKKILAAARALREKRKAKYASR